MARAIRSARAVRQHGPLLAFDQLDACGLADGARQFVDRPGGVLVGVLARTTLTMILPVFLAVGAACLLYATTALQPQGGVPRRCAARACVRWRCQLILFYREHAADLILRHYLCRNAGAAALTVLLAPNLRPLLSAAARPRLLMPASTMSAILARRRLGRAPGRLPRSSSGAGGARASRSVRRGGDSRSATPSYIRNITSADASRRPL